MIDVENTTHLEMHTASIRVLVVPMASHDDLGDGELCETCWHCKPTLSWIIEIQPFLSNLDNNYMMVAKEICVRCEDIAEVLAYESAERVKTLYGAA